jgi:hypothetical protein
MTNDPKIDLQSILKEYSIDEDDFGFSAVSEEEYNKAVNESEQTVEAYKKKLIELEKMVVPFLMKLLKSADKEYIYWPNRKAPIENQIEKILKITRS